jgi:hypothetical protein
MRDSENPDLFPMQERKAVDVYAHRVARNSVLSDVAAVAAADALAGRTPAPVADALAGRTPAPVADARPRASASLAGTDRGGEQGHADEHESDQQYHGHTDPVPGTTS